MLFIGFKGKNNSSCMLVKGLSDNPFLLTNSFEGLRKDIESLKDVPDTAVMFGADKTLSAGVRIERSAAINGEKIVSNLKLEAIAKAIKKAGAEAEISDNPTAYLCNEAYGLILKRFSGRAVFIHIPTVKYADECFGQKMKKAFLEIEKIQL